MARQDKRITVYPSPRAGEILGTSAPRLNAAIDCWAEAIARATAQNAALFDRTEWMYLADLLRGVILEPGFGTPGAILADDARDGAAHDGLGRKWFGETADRDVAALAAKLEDLDYTRAWAVVLSVQHFWASSDDERAGQWWTIAARRAAAAP